MALTRTGHFWFDSGLVGLIKILERVNIVRVNIEGNSVVLEGSKENIQSALEEAYKLLIKECYNLSTEKQRIDKENYNFYYDSKEGCFKAFPKRKSVGIAELIFNKAPRPVGSSIGWVEKKKREIKFNDRVVKRTRGILPPSHAHLQEQMDKFLDENGLDVTTSGLLVDGPNAVRPNVEIRVGGGKPKGICYLCGKPGDYLDEAKETVFPLITGSSGVLSFNSQAGSPEKVCWKCALLGKFVPVNGFYFYQGDHLFIFLPYSVSLEKMAGAYDLLRDMEYKHPNLYYNFEHSLGGYFQRPFEVAFTFLYTLYEKVLLQRKGEEDKPFEDLSWEKLYDLPLIRDQVDFYVLHAKKEGNTFSCKMAWPFQDVSYFFRLMSKIEQAKVKVQEAMRLLVDYNQPQNENKTLMRNRICERVLKKQPILDLTEEHVYRADLGYFKPLMDFLYYYELERRGGTVTKEEQEAAVTLGRRVGTAVGKSESAQRGDLFPLRKARKKVDFLEQLNRLQFKLGRDFIIPAEVYEGKLRDENFLEFKQWCMIAALNSFNAATSKSSVEKG
jgi:hypothetical protein